MRKSLIETGKPSSGAEWNLPGRSSYTRRGGEIRSEEPQGPRRQLGGSLRSVDSFLRLFFYRIFCDCLCSAGGVLTQPHRWWLIALALSIWLVWKGNSMAGAPSGVDPWEILIARCWEARDRRRPAPPGWRPVDRSAPLVRARGCRTGRGGHLEARARTTKRSAALTFPGARGFNSLYLSRAADPSTLLLLPPRGL